MRLPAGTTHLAAVLLLAATALSAGSGDATPVPDAHVEPRPAPDAVPVAPGTTEPYGVDGGTVPQFPLPSFAGVPIPLAAGPQVPGLPAGSGATAGIPGLVLAAYQRAAARLAADTPACGLPVALLAAIGKVESGHARDGRVDAAGTALSPILGPVLDGRAGTAAIADTDGGVLDGNAAWDRAVGPMQFIPSTWRRWAADGNGDGRADPENVADAAEASGRYLCAGGRDLRSAAGLDSAVLSYNHSAAYLSQVRSWMLVYQGAVAVAPDPRFAAAAAPQGAPVLLPPATAPGPAAVPPPVPPPGTPPVPPTSVPAPPPTSGTRPAPPTTSAPPPPVSAVPVLDPVTGLLTCTVTTVTGALGGLLGGLLGGGTGQPAGGECPPAG
ncbi:lytic transglycosylase domain-containing protein [Amycolatopsis sp., V23-08]|uniref:Lytic transglycosylase domain-containing protein n=1 Tax=Amycolatopsis heterodermiae TaxID=3110235 RepID=A0ABU5RJA7_9PSEU|nr:lytic transglycosylase domain-containing protein [Amycolatopsis sp., V23-08]MEA5365226.1 lytic transglycosylase domain-containing protein [Amycolatopsis sp., V23-08]